MTVLEIRDAIGTLGALLVVAGGFMLLQIWAAPR
jgi:hypothetical protein